jgi:hypothetical protein
MPFPTETYEKHFKDYQPNKTMPCYTQIIAESIRWDWKTVGVFVNGPTFIFLSNHLK